METSALCEARSAPSLYPTNLGDPTIADAICDRLLHNAHPLVLQGASRRKEFPGKD